jgi:hypothetical protein
MLVFDMGLVRYRFRDLADADVSNVRQSRRAAFASVDGDVRHRSGAGSHHLKVTTSVSAEDRVHPAKLFPQDPVPLTSKEKGQPVDRTKLTTRLALGVAALATVTAVTMPALSGALSPAYGATSANAPAARVGHRGELVSAQQLRTLSAAQAAAELASDRFDPSTVRYGVDTYRLVYRTIDPQGRPTTASGLLVLPRNHARRLRTASFAHGTELFKGDAPSVAQDVWGSAPAITYASAGFAAVAPDYLGLGVGPGPHPWMDVPSETTASLDMLRAARRFVARTSRELQREVLVTGFSQGASAAMALARALQAGADRWFQLGAVAPVSGAYDFQQVELPAVLNGELPPKVAVVYAAYLLVAWNRLHHLYDSPAEVFQPPYDRTIEQLFDSQHTGQQVVAGTPDDIGQLLTPHALQMLRHPTGPLAAALQVADSTCADWSPRAPIRLYIATADEQAPNANSYHCQAALRSHGVDAPIVSVGDVDHLDSNRLGTAAVVRWFGRLSFSGQPPR